MDSGKHRRNEWNDGKARAARIAAVALTIALAVGCLRPVAALAAGTAQSMMRVSATVLAASCPAGVTLRACTHPVQSVTRVERYETVDADAPLRGGAPSLHAVSGELMIVTLTY